MYENNVRHWLQIRTWRTLPKICCEQTDYETKIQNAYRIRQGKINWIIPFLGFKIWTSNEVISTQESRMSWVLSELTIRIFYLGILRGHKLEIFQVFHHKIFIWTLMTWTLIWEFHNELFSTRIFIWRIIIQTITKLLIISTICFYWIWRQ